MTTENNPDSGPLRLTCIACGEETEYRCPFCEIYARKRVGLCGRSECREEHEDIDCIRTPKGQKI